MAAYKTWWADRYRFTVTGPHPQHFLSRAAARGILLQGVRCLPGGGYAATAAGADRPKLEALAARGPWSLQILRRRGPGPWVERLLARPGLPVGAALFFVLVKLLCTFVWSMDFGDLEADDQKALRALLAENGIQEGVYLTQSTLTAAQTAASRQSERYGWISLNFTGGCLFVEQTPAQYQAIEPVPTPTALYAKAAGQVLAVEAQSGFAVVAPGQYVARGQTLVDSIKLDRDGDPVSQGAAGIVTARVLLRYVATQSTEATAPRLTGRSSYTESLCFLGRHYRQDDAPLPLQGETQTEWLPLRLGRLALPGSLCRQTVWERTAVPVSYTPEQAQALAARACRRQLMTDYPDAVIETEQREYATTEAGEQCKILYTFRANIAAKATEAAPLPTPLPDK